MRRRERGRPGTREERGRRGKGAKSKGEEGANSPFYSKPGIPRCCQVTVGLKFRQNNRSLRCGST